jgi:hypothetical protein
MIELPTERSVVDNYNPKLLVIFGKPKSGKSSFVAAIDDNLIIDLEDGYRALSVMKVQARTARDMHEIKAAILAKGAELKRAPYRFITIDNATRLEEMSVPVAADLYRNTPMGSGWGMLTDAKGMPVKDPKTGKLMPDPKADVRLLPNGAGYLYMRKAMRQLIDMFKPLCETLILVTHVKEKQIKKDSEEMSEMAVDLAGKTGDIVCGEADAVGYLYRDGNKTYLSFEGGDNTIREARPLHLRGKKILVAESNENNEVKFDTSKVFI